MASRHHKDPSGEEPHNYEQFEEFADLMLNLVNSFNEVMKGDDRHSKLSAIELLGEVKSTMGDSLMHLMEKYDIYPKDIERVLKEDQSEISQKVLEVHNEIEKVNREVLPEIEKALGITKKEKDHKRKNKMLKRLRPKD